MSFERHWPEYYVAATLNPSMSIHTFYIPQYFLFCFTTQAPFLSALIDLKPDLCITAAYGNMLPQVCHYAASEGNCHEFKVALAQLKTATLGIIFLMTSVRPHYTPVPRPSLTSLASGP